MALLSNRDFICDADNRMALLSNTDFICDAAPSKCYQQYSAKSHTYRLRHCAGERKVEEPNDCMSVSPSYRSTHFGLCHFDGDHVPPTDSRCISRVAPAFT